MERSSASGSGGMRFKSRAGQIFTHYQRLATAANFKPGASCRDVL